MGFHRQFYVNKNVLKKANTILEYYGLDCTNVLKIFVNASVYRKELIIEPKTYNSPITDDMTFVSYSSSDVDKINQFQKLCNQKGVSMTDMVKTLFNKICDEKSIAFLYQ